MASFIISGFIMLSERDPTLGYTRVNSDVNALVRSKRSRSCPQLGDCLLLRLLQTHLATAKASARRSWPRWLRAYDACSI